MESIVLGGGCFWCVEAAYQLIKGVDSVVPGYGGGKGSKPDYHSLHGGSEGWAEVVRLTYDPKTISFEEILEIFWTIHDPTTPDRQGHDIGSEYRSLILYSSSEQKNAAIKSRDDNQKLWEDPIVTEIAPLGEFYEAEPEHHNFFQKHPEQAYCQVVINPKLQKLQSKFADKLKK